MKDKRQYRLNRRRFLQLTGGASALGLLAACTPATGPAAGSESAAPAEEMVAEAATGGTMIWAGHTEVAGLSPNDSGPTVHFAMITNIHDPMLNLTENLELEPYLAESYEVSEDGLQYTFNLRQGVKFHDGTDFTAADVKYTFEFYSDVETGSVLANNFQGMASVEATDDYTIVITMNEPNAAFLVNAATTLIVPAAYHAEVGEDVYRTQPIGTGPFKLAEWVAAEYTLLEANEAYMFGRPKVDFLRQEVIPEPSVRAIALETGDVHYATWPLLVEDSIRMRDSGEGFHVFETPASSVKHFPLNNDHPVLGDKSVRKAMMHALDRQRIIDDLWNSAAVVATSNLSPASSYYNPNVTLYEYDVEKAVALLEEAGWAMGDDGVRVKDGVRCHFVCATIIGDQARRPIAEFAQQAFQEIGIEMELQETGAASSGMRSGELESSLYNWTYGSVADPDASTVLRSDGANNFSKFRNERVDELLDLGLGEADPEKRKEYYAEIQEIVAEEVPFLFLQYDTWFDVFRPEVGGIPEPGTVKDGNRLMRKAYLMTIEG